MWRWSLVVLGVAWSGPALAQDQVVPLRGTPVSGNVVKISTSEVVVEARGKQQRVPVNEIRRVTFREEPADLRRGRNRILIGRIESGLADLKKVAIDQIERDEIKQDLQFYLAYAEGRLVLEQGGDAAKAASGLFNFAKNHPTSFHFFATAEILGELSAAQGKYGDAARYYKAIGKAPWPEYKIRSVVLEGRARLAQQQFAAAKALFDSADKLPADSPEAKRQQQLATIGQAICLAELDAPEQGEQILTELIDKADPQDTALYGHAYNALGRCYLKASRPKDALLAFLHVDILFYADAEVHAESLYHLSQLWKTVRRADRAVTARQLLAEKYSGSRWAKLDP